MLTQKTVFFVAPFNCIVDAIYGQISKGKLAPWEQQQAWFMHTKRHFITLLINCQDKLNDIWEDNNTKD